MLPWHDRFLDFVTSMKRDLASKEDFMKQVRQNLASEPQAPAEHSKTAKERRFTTYLSETTRDDAQIQCKTTNGSAGSR